MPSAAPRTFRVHDRASEACHARRVSETSFEAAAVAYLEAHGVAGIGADEITLIVRDIDSGHERCFRIDLADGAATARA